MDKEFLQHLRHSTAHLLAAAILELWPNAKRTIGPAIAEGFYYDFDFGDEKPSEKDFEKIEQKMHEIAKTWKKFEKSEITKEEALELFKNNQYKKELIEEFSQEGKKLTLFKSGNYTDLCKGGHSEQPDKELKHFKLLSLAGAYWRGNEKNPMLTRIYGTAFGTKQELIDYLNMREEAKKRDHRKLGKELDLFVFSELVGSGLPMFTPKGTIIREELFAFSESLQKRYGYQKVWIPHITKVALYETSGHWDKFGDELFLVESQETSDKFVLKPMNCPHHTQIYASRTRSYKDLPIRYMETTTQYRDEKAGELLGLSRVRSISIDDAHAFVRPDQVEEEFRNIMSMIKEMYAALDLKFKARLSFKDESDKYLGDQKHWDDAQRIIEDVAKKLELDYFVAWGEAAFYGPKIDIMVYDALGREWQCATEQLDFVQPMRFGLTYIDADGTEKTPFMIHKALLGSIERFLSVYIEHTAGAFPLWLSPVQIALLPIADRHAEYAKEVVEALQKEGIRAELDNRQERLQAKIRDNTLQKVPFMGIIGDKELANGQISVRARKGEDLGQISVESFITTLKENIDKKRI
ncbi:MAG TPA: threonine--tRNA ligase [Candidatus Saccharimonadales bacterium]|nr:threonine--tRNA ligase [Candidatus Saccharimonadales bacterium]